MKKNNKTAMVMSAAVLTLVLMGTACSNNNNATTSSPSASPSVTASPQSSQDPATENASPSASPEIQSGTGKYTGLQDNHTIEITTDQGPTAYQVSPEIADKVDPWGMDTPVKFEYTTEHTDANGEKFDQLTIVSIDKQ
ncbi:hypothetical protein D7Z26_10500 [Cohnella endophytica]|uniref:Uncharacterized protein n=1 Tax=Cohnella endophytica TaxID=2419778 RepID=A0A494Y0D8_9BACL|nr:hypothetical protein [Cohnella endophytica]RKP53822.1 hypothetical protein D7Z26_10500 [Cohnella endophytica]